MIIKYANGVQESGRARLQRILPLLACPRCGGALASQELHLVCQTCAVQHPIRGGVPILLPAGVQDAGAIVASAEDRVSRHPYSARAEEIIEAHAPGWVLDLGAGGKLERRENVVQIDIFRYPSVDVVGSADCIPFGDNSFDAVISQAVFEHLQYPEWAVSEVRRVLKPGGIAKIDTAFLQPEHGYPHHFYNATETGLLHWFRDFDIEWSGVEPFQHPKWALHWFLGVYLDYIGRDEASVLRQLTVGHLIDALQRHADGQTTPDDLQIIKALDALPDHLQRVLAAGVSVHAINPAKHDVAVIAKSPLSPLSLDREREMAQLRAEKIVLSKAAAELRERLKVAQDKALYLTQFYPNASNVVRLAALWALPQQHLGPHDTAAETRATGKDGVRPFATLVVYPSAVAPLLDTFFSLTNQTYGGWELVLVTRAVQSASVMRAVEALCQLDQRVLAVSDEHIAIADSTLNCAATRGEYWIQLPEGATLAFNALEEVVTLARNLPGISGIGFDFDRATNGAGNAIRCHTQIPFDVDTRAGHAGGFESRFFRATDDDQQAVNGSTNARNEDAHIPSCLVHLDPSVLDVNAPLKASLAYLLEQNREKSEALRQGLLGRIKQIGLLRWTRQHIAILFRKYLPAAIWTRIFKLKSRFDNRHASPLDRSKFKPFVTFSLEPKSATALNKTFFSLTQQNYSGWELLLIVGETQSSAVRHAAQQFSDLDERVVVIDTSIVGGNPLQSISTKTRGDYSLRLVDGVTLQTNALEEVVTLALAQAGTERITSDFDVARRGGYAPMRCHNEAPSDFVSAPIAQEFFNATFVRSASGHVKHKSVLRSGGTSHIPLCLFHL